MEAKEDQDSISPAGLFQSFSTAHDVASLQDFFPITNHRSITISKTTIILSLLRWKMKNKCKHC